jgi:hypothetical protein
VSSGRYLAGESLRPLCTWLTDQGIATVTGSPWRSPTLRGLLRSGRIAGLREHLGEVVGPGRWAAITVPADRDRVLARMAERALSGRRARAGMCSLACCAAAAAGASCSRHRGRTAAATSVFIPTN